MKNIKSLGQHWLKDRSILDQIVEFAEVKSSDVVLEIGPGLGTLTSALLRRAKAVVAVELDSQLASNLPAQFPGKALKVINQDILQFDLGKLAKDYKVVANLPYYITAKIIDFLLTSNHQPSLITVLVQKEVAQRLAQINGGSVLGIAVANRAEVELGPIVKSEMFTPPPKVDSQVVKLKVRRQPQVVNEAAFMRVVKAGFSAKRKKLYSSLAGGLNLSKDQAKQLIEKAKIDPNLRAENLSFADWQRLYLTINS